MVYVCQEWFPIGSYKRQREPGFWMDELLCKQIDILIKNIKNDWDFTIIVTGGGEVRVGKSVLAMQIGAYWTWRMWKEHNIKLPFSVQDNFVLEGKKLIEFGNKLGKNFPYSFLCFDEAGADLEGTKMMTQMTQDVMDYYRECGQYNMLNVLVLPDYFTLPIGLALTRSICLIDVYYSVGSDDVFERGYFNFYSRKNKKELYLKGKKDRNYKAAKYSFNGKFSNVYPVNEIEYRKLKQETLVKRESKRRNKFQMQRDACWFLLTHDIGWSLEELGRRMEGLTGIFVPHNTLSDGIGHFKMENE
jgi:hypothetical protein